jgi:hypothetical protein
MRIVHERDPVIEPSKRHVDDDFSFVSGVVEHNVVENLDETGEISFMDVVVLVFRVVVEIPDDDELSILG